MAQRVDGLLQKFREAAALVKDEVGKLVAADAAKADEIERLKVELADAQAALTKFDGSYIVSDADIDEMGNIAAGFQGAAIAASMRTSNNA